MKIKKQECNGDLCGSIEYCNKPSPDGIYVCTRKIGHTGNLNITCPICKSRCYSVFKSDKEVICDECKTVIEGVKI